MFYLIFIIGLLLSLSKNKKLNSRLYIFILMILAIFRYGSGPDYFSYKYLFNILRPNIIDEFYYGLNTQEIGFRLIGAFLKQIGVSYQVYLSVFAIISLFYIYKICTEYSYNSTLSITIYYSFYYFVWTYSGIRQGLVMAIGIYYLLEAIKKNKIQKFAIITILLSFIHTSVLILLVFIFVPKLNLDKNKLILFIILSTIFSILPVGTIILKFAPHIPILNRIVVYSSSNISLNNIIDFQTIGRLIFLIIIIWFYDNYVKIYPKQKGIVDIYIFSFILYFLFKFSELTAARLAIYGKMLDILILPNIVYLIKGKRNKLMAIMILVIIMSLYLFKELWAMEKSTGLVDFNLINTPYVNIFNKDNYFYNNRFNLIDVK